MNYQPGSHIIATLHTSQTGLIGRYGQLRSMLDAFIGRSGLCRLGEVYHQFEPAGYTLVICLSESHISMHTWPEFGKVNLDIYLSNHTRNNNAVGLELFQALVDFFQATIHQYQVITR
jgi:S-adenosylmethionine decarboxylase